MPSDLKIEVKKISTGSIKWFEHVQYFTDNKTILINCTSSDQLEGEKKEILTITFNWENFKSSKGTKLLTQTLETNPHSFV